MNAEQLVQRRMAAQSAAGAVAREDDRRDASLVAVAVRGGTRGMLVGWAMGALLGVAASLVWPLVDISRAVVLGVLVLGFEAVPPLTSVMQVARAWSRTSGRTGAMALMRLVVTSAGVGAIWAIVGLVVLLLAAPSAGLRFNFLQGLLVTVGYGSMSGSAVALLVAVSRLHTRPRQ